MVYWLLSLFIPVILHLSVSEMIALWAGRYWDMTLCTTLAALVVIPAAAVMFYKDNKKHTNPNEAHIKKKSVFWGAGCFVAGGILNIIWSSFLNLLQIGMYFSNETQEILFAADVVLQIIGLGILVPVAEELIFRGLVYNRMKQMLGAGVSIFFSSLLFAVYHGNPIQMIFAFPMALALNWVYHKGKWFLYPVLFHMGSNLTAIFVNLLV